ncbi:DUF1844 domain-containing protein [Hoyosella rhizosphaerae]|nr:DUF1844 domain-containing protein [Hoyosella rhizosphaerae]
MADDSYQTASPSSDAPLDDGKVHRVNTTNQSIDDESALPIRELAEIPAIEVISRAAVMLMSSAAEKLGLSEADPMSSAHLDLDEARRIITALAGLITASGEFLGPHAGPLKDGLQALQRAFRENSAYPDEPGQGPGEKYTGPVY